MKLHLLLSSLASYVGSIAFLSAQIVGPTWVGHINGGQTENGTSVDLDWDGNAVACGTFQYECDLDPTAGEYLSTAFGYQDGYIVKVDPNGAFLWAKHIGGGSGSTEVFINDITTDEERNIIVVGKFTESVDFDPGIGVHIKTSINGYDPFILKLTPTGEFVWVYHIEGSAYDDDCKAVAYNFYDDQIVVGGYFSETFTFGTALIYSAGGSPDGYMAVFDDNGLLVDARHLVSVDGFATRVNTVTFDDNHGIYAGGMFSGTTAFTLWGLENQMVSNGGEDIFLARYDLNDLSVWTYGIGGVQAEECLDMKYDSYSQSVVTTGYFEGLVDFDNSPTSDLILDGSAHGSAFILRVGADGQFQMAKGILAEFGANSSGRSITSDVSSNIFITGNYQAESPGTVDFDPNEGNYYWTSAGGSDVFIYRLNYDGDDFRFDVFQGEYNEYGNGIVSSYYGDRIVTTGTFQDVTDFIGTGPEQWLLTSNNGTRDAYLTNYAFFLLPPVAIDEQEKNENLLVYPNPTNGTVSIKVPESGTVAVVDMLGKTVQTINLLNGTNQLDLSNLSNGVYHLRFRGKTGLMQSTKLLLTR